VEEFFFLLMMNKLRSSMPIMHSILGVSLRTPSNIVDRFLIEKVLGRI
jgi:hypothetical protein